MPPEAITATRTFQLVTSRLSSRRPSGRSLVHPAPPADDTVENFALFRLETMRDRTAIPARAEPAPVGKASPGPR